MTFFQWNKPVGKGAEKEGTEYKKRLESLIELVFRISCSGSSSVRLSAAVTTAVVLFVLFFWCEISCYLISRTYNVTTTAITTKEYTNS